MDSDVKSEEKPMPRSKDKEKETLIMLKYHRLSYRSGLKKDITLYRYWREIKENLSKEYSDSIWNNRLSLRDKERIEDIRTIFGDNSPQLNGNNRFIVEDRREIRNYPDEETQDDFESGIPKSMFSEEELNSSAAGGRGIIRWLKDKFSALFSGRKEDINQQIDRILEAKEKESEEAQKNVAEEDKPDTIEYASKKVNYKRLDNITHKIEFKDTSPEKLIEGLKQKLTKETPEDPQARIEYKLDIISCIIDLRTVANAIGEQKTGDELIEEYLQEDNAQSEIDKLEEAKKFEKKCIYKIMEDKDIPKRLTLDLYNDKGIECLIFDEEKSSKLRTLRIKDGFCKRKKLIALNKELLEEELNESQEKYNNISLRKKEETENELNYRIKEITEKLNEVQKEEKLFNLWEFDLEKPEKSFLGEHNELKDWAKLVDEENELVQELNLLGDE